MKIIIQDIENKDNAYHVVKNFDSFNIKRAVEFAIKQEYGGGAKIEGLCMNPSVHHHADYVIVTGVEYDGSGTERYPVLCNGDTLYLEKSVLKRLTTKVRIEIKLDTLAQKKLNCLQKLIKEIKFRKMIKSQFDN